MEMTLLEKSTVESLEKLKHNYENLTSKIVQLKNLSEDLTRKTEEERQRQSSTNIVAVSEQTRARYTQLRNNIIEGHRRLQSAVPLLIFLGNTRSESSENMMQPLIEMAVDTLSRFSNAANAFGVGIVPKKEGLSQEEIDKLKVLVWSKSTAKKNETYEACPICYTDYCSGDHLKCLPCDHIFHTPCIEEWLKKKAKCPMCNKEIKSEESN